jgi:transglutaminase-like putative cysteine protease
MSGRVSQFRWRGTFGGAVCLGLFLGSVAIGQDRLGTADLTARLLDLFPDSSAAAESVITYQVEQTVRVDQIPDGAKQLRLWVSLPGDDAQQTVQNLEVVSAPGPWEIVTDIDHRGLFLAVTVDNPAESIDVTTAFRLRREPAYVPVDPARVGPMNDSLRALLAEHLDRKAPHMEVTPAFQLIADDVCGHETNIAIQARLLLEHVAATVDHYSYSTDPNMPSCGIGDSVICKKQGGGCCTDLNSYFITLARSRGIPARLNMGYRLPERNRGQLVDPGYRCWIEYFVPNYGWISADIVEADTPGGLGQNRWLSGLTSRRLWLNQGREFQLEGVVGVARINHMSIGYAEVDGQPVRLLPEGASKPQLTRKVLFTELASPVAGELTASPGD